MNQQGVRSIILIALGLVWGGLIATWAEQPKSGGTLPVAFEADVTGLDPAIPGLQNYYVNQNLFNTLVTLNENLEFIPDMAESWEIQAQGKFYLFHLRRGVKFHDGTGLDAAAVKWNLDRIIADEKAPAHRFFANVESSEVLDAHTLKITMLYPTTTLLSALATNGTGLHIISPTSEKTWGKDVLRHPSGTRPFRFVTWEPNARIVLERNPHYFKPGLPYLDRIEYRVMKEGVTRVAALRAGEVDFINWTPRESLERYPYDPERARASLKEAGFDEKNPLRYTIMTHGAEPSLPTIATIIKTQMAAIGVEVTVEVIDRPIFLKRLLRDRDYDQVINMALPFLDVGDRGFVLERGGLNLPNHSDSKIDDMFDQWRRALDASEQRKIAAEIQRYVADTAVYTAVCGNPIVNAHRAEVKGYTYARAAGDVRAHVARSTVEGGE